MPTPLQDTAALTVDRAPTDRGASNRLTPADIRAFARAQECDRVELKRRFQKNDTHQYRKIITAFCNDMPGHRAPGYLLFGVEDDGRFAELPITDSALRCLTDLRLQGHILPVPRVSIYRVEVALGVEVAVVEVYPSQQPPVRLQGQIWIRVGSSTVLATLEEARALTERREERTFDATYCPSATLNDVDLCFFREEYLPRMVPPERQACAPRSDVAWMEALRLWHRGLTREGPTNAAMLLMPSREPGRFFTGLWLLFVRFDGDSRAAEATHRWEFHGSVFSQLEVLQWIDDFIEITSLEDGTVAPEYPAQAIRELVSRLLRRSRPTVDSPHRLSKRGHRRGAACLRLRREARRRCASDPGIARRQRQHARAVPLERGQLWRLPVRPVVPLPRDPRRLAAVDAQPPPQ